MSKRLFTVLIVTAGLVSVGSALAAERAALRAFIGRHPTSPLASGEAQQRLAVLDRATREREAAAAEAKKRQVEREAAQEWEKIRSSTDPSALLAFLSWYPNAAVSDQVRRRVADLERQARERLERQQQEAEAAQREWDGIKSTDNRAALRAFIARHPTSPLASGEAQQRLAVLDREAKERAQQAAAAEAKKRQVEREAAQEWEKLKLSTDPPALLAFLSRYPNAAVSDQARQRVADLERQARERQQEAEAAQREWDGIKSTDNRAALKAFIGRHPTSPLASGEAQQRLAVLDREARERAQQAAAAEEKKRQVEREAAQEWEKLKLSTDPPALLAFLSRYPNVAVSDQARQRVADLERQARERQQEAEAAQREWDDIKSTDDRAALKAFIGRHPTSPLATDEAQQRLAVLDREAREREQQAAAAKAKKRQVEREAAQQWETVRSSTDPSALLAFLSWYPNVAVSDQARQRVADLDREARERLERQQQEAEAAQREWDSIKSTDDRAALKAFIARHPTSPLASGEAQQRLAVLDREAKEREQQTAAAEAQKRQVEREAAQEWEKVKLSTDPPALLAFLSRYPNAAVSDQARQRVADLDRQARERLERQQQEAEAVQREWDGLKSTDDRAALKAFIGRHPTSPLASGEAQQRLGVLDRGAREPPWPEGPYKYLVIDQDLKGVLVEFGRNLRVPVDVSDQVRGRLRGQLRVAPAREFLEKLCESYGLVWYFDGAVLHISAKTEIRTELINIGRFPPAEVNEKLNALGIGDPRYPVKTTEDVGVVAVSGPPPFVSLVRRTLTSLAPPPVREEPRGDEPTVRVFRGGALMAPPQIPARNVKVVRANAESA